jgi:urea transport system ATP-binding protein
MTAPAGAAVLVVEHLTVSFDGFKAVDDLSFYVGQDELRALIGPNGAGKTTVLDLISGRTRASAGNIRFGTLELTDMREHEIVRAGVGRKFQTPSVYDALTVFENLEMSYPAGRTALGAWTFKCTPEVKDKVEEIAVLIGLQEKLHQPAELLSHGQ